MSATRAAQPPGQRGRSGRRQLQVGTAGTGTALDGEHDFVATMMSGQD